MMQCPVCAVSMQAERHHHLRFEICPRCRGIWVAGPQFRTLAATVAAEGRVPSASRLTFQPRKVLRPSPENPMRICPKCRKPMREFNYAYDSNVFLDRCDQCRGIWLDANEIIDIAAHIQYDPDMDAMARSLLQATQSDMGIEDDANRLTGFLQMAWLILRAVVFRV